LGAQFNPGPDQAPPQARTKETLKKCLAKFVERCQKCKDKNLKEKPTNEKGVNCSGLLDIDPERIIVPILHCRLGLIDKVLVAFNKYVNLHVEDLYDDEKEVIRSVYLGAISDHEKAADEYDNWIETCKAQPANTEAKRQKKLANTRRIAAQTAEREAKLEYAVMRRSHNAGKDSLVQQFERIYSQRNIDRESYHGGSFNGMQCIKLMENAHDLFVGTDEQVIPSFLKYCLQYRSETSAERQTK
jgi:hypothetical protein